MAYTCQHRHAAHGHCARGVSTGLHSCAPGVCISVHNVGVDDIQQALHHDPVSQETTQLQAAQQVGRYKMSQQREVAPPWPSAPDTPETAVTLAASAASTHPADMHLAGSSPRYARLHMHATRTAVSAVYTRPGTGAKLSLASKTGALHVTNACIYMHACNKDVLVDCCLSSLYISIHDQVHKTSYP